MWILWDIFLTIILNNDKYGIGDKKWKHEQLMIKWKKYNNDDQITDGVVSHISQIGDAGYARGDAYLSGDAL
jgi:hypothetical protein